MALKLKKVIVASLPALAIVSWLVVFRVWLKDISTYNTTFGVLLGFGMAYLIGLITAFFSNLILPIATNRRSAIQIATPSLFTYLFFFVILYIVVLSLNGDFNNLERIGFAIIAFCFVYIPMGLLLMVSVAFFGWLGARIRMGSQSRSSL